MSPASPISPQPSPAGAVKLEPGSSNGAADKDTLETTLVTNRRRRHSDSITPETLAPHRSNNDETGSNKRSRRMSGEPEPPIGANDGRFGLSLTSLTSNFKWLSHLWKNKTGQQDKMTTTPVLHSWPLNNNNRVQEQQQQSAAKTAQLKITEFFSTQVKHHWTYSKHKELKERLPAETRVSIVSVAHVDNSLGANLQRGASPLDRISQEKKTSATPQQIRFPVDKTNNKNDAALPACPDQVQCLWKNCTASLVSGQSLLDHIQSAHVSTQASSSKSATPSSSNASSPIPESAPATATTEQYSCEWEGCKVQSRKSSSRTWLERHVLLHVGNKPFRCIVDSCEQRFGSQVRQKKKKPGKRLSSSIFDSLVYSGGSWTTRECSF